MVNLALDNALWQSKSNQLLQAIIQLRDEARHLLVRQMGATLADDRDILLSEIGHLSTNQWSETTYTTALYGGGLIAQAFKKKVNDSSESKNLAKFLGEERVASADEVVFQQPKLMKGATLKPLEQSAKRLQAIQDLKRDIEGLKDASPTDRAGRAKALAICFREKHEVIMAGVPRYSAIARLVVSVTSVLKSLVSFLAPAKRVSPLAMGSSFSLFMHVHNLSKQVESTAYKSHQPPVAHQLSK